ncbi:hypothetical protein [Mycolicibacterium goodii]|uniref:hypothetical protein n=1 Tax=Mycolicibacterium goodii TaxID=134601 RepID=UPI001BDC5F8A|nr:hypothetical protein [Mycolicibacterium goodii]MBU8807774.1 hypothetical protein [Mycolicibacterium goodii]MBU8828105.1 hypothetical protein [Mycolicibacterium goodii]ULN47396.1 hypothetical protein MI170_29815 [Mycolicibacterium goodii]
MADAVTDIRHGGSTEGNDLRWTLTGHLGPVPRSTVVAAWYIVTLPAEKQQALREQEARGELCIAPREQIGTIQ